MKQTYHSQTPAIGWLISLPKVKLKQCQETILLVSFIHLGYHFDRGRGILGCLWKASKSKAACSKTSRRSYTPDMLGLHHHRTCIFYLPVMNLGAPVMIASVTISEVAAHRQCPHQNCSPTLSCDRSMAVFSLIDTLERPKTSLESLS